MLLRWENRMLCKMQGTRLRPGEMWSDFESRRVNEQCTAGVSCFRTKIPADGGVVATVSFCVKSVLGLGEKRDA